MSLIDISKVNKKGGTQSRASVNLEVVSDYADAVKDGAQFPPVVVFFDGSEYWLADGFHRYEAFARAGASEIHADVRQGTRRDAILYSVGANAHHGLRRTNDDKRRAVMVLLNDVEWSKWSDREIARQAGVHYNFVGKLRKDVTITRSDSEGQPKERNFTDKHGNQVTMNTAKIGGGSKPDQEDVTVQKPNNNRAQDEDQPKEGANPVAADQEIDPETAKVMKELAKLTPDGVAEEVMGLRAVAAERKAEIASLKREVADLKDENKALRESEGGRSLGNALRQARAAEGRMREHQAAAARLQRQVNAQKAEIEKLRKADQDRLIPL